MRRFALAVAVLLCTCFRSHAYVYCDDCWASYENGVTVNYTFTGGGDDCFSSFHRNNMYPWATAYVYQDGVLIDVIRTNSSNVSCMNYV